MTDDSQEGYIIEFIVVGKSVKVTAMDPVTLKEVSIIGARGASRRELAALAVRKLQYVMAKKGDA
jgi:hypothetical protein